MPLTVGNEDIDNVHRHDARRRDRARRGRDRRWVAAAVPGEPGADLPAGRWTRMADVRAAGQNRMQRRLHVRDDRDCSTGACFARRSAARDQRLVPEGGAVMTARTSPTAAWNSRRADPTTACRWCSRRRPPILSGLVTDDRGKPVLDATVVDVPGQSRAMDLTCRAIVRTMRPDTNGRYSIKNLPPAEDYLIIAVQNLEQGQGSDPEFLTRAREEAKPFSLNEGETKAVDVKLSSTGSVGDQRGTRHRRRARRHNHIVISNCSSRRTLVALSARGIRAGSGAAAQGPRDAGSARRGRCRRGPMRREARRCCAA